MIQKLRQSKTYFVLINNKFYPLNKWANSEFIGYLKKIVGQREKSQGERLLN